jgi:hypothetical protein
VELTAFRLGGAALIGLLAGWLVRSSAPAGPAVEPPPPRAEGSRALRALRTGFVEVVDETAPWVVLGVVVLAAVEPGALQPLLAEMPPGGDLLLFGLLGVPVYICAAGATPLGAALLIVGASPGAALVFVLTGAATSLAQTSHFRTRHGSGAAWAAVAVVLIVAMGLGALANAALGGAALVVGGGLASSGPVAWVALSLLGAAYAGSLLRHGPMAFVRQVVGLETHTHGDEHSHGEGGHGHDGEHGHAHGEHDHGHGHGRPEPVQPPHFHARLGVGKD